MITINSYKLGRKFTFHTMENGTIRVTEVKGPSNNPALAYLKSVFDAKLSPITDKHGAVIHVPAEYHRTMGYKAKHEMLRRICYAWLRQKYSREYRPN